MKSLLPRAFAIGDLGGVDARRRRRRVRRRAARAGRRRRGSSRCRRRGRARTTCGSCRRAPDQRGGSSARRIDRLALLADLEVQLHAVGVGRAHLGDLLAALDGLVVLDQQRLVVRVGGEVGRVVLEDHQVAVAAQAGAGVDDAAVGGGEAPDRRPCRRKTRPLVCAPRRTAPTTGPAAGQAQVDVVVGVARRGGCGVAAPVSGTALPRAAPARLPTAPAAAGSRGASSGRGSTRAVVTGRRRRGRRVDVAGGARRAAPGPTSIRFGLVEVVPARQVMPALAGVEADRGSACRPACTV